MKSSIPIGQSFKFIPRPLDKDWDQEKSNCDLIYMASFWRETNRSRLKKKNLKESSWFGEPKRKLRSKVVHFFIFFLVFYSCCSNSVRLEEMLWIEDIVQSTQAPPFLTNLKVDMASFIDPHKVIIRKSAFLALPNAWNGGELKGGAKSGRLKR